MRLDRKSVLAVLLSWMLLLAVTPVWSQQSSTGWITGSGAPSGSCSNGVQYINFSNGYEYFCRSGVWSASSNVVLLAVATDGTGVYNATGTNDQTPIQSAINAANSAGGGTVYIKHSRYHLSACVTPANNVKTYGDRPGLTGFDGQSNDYWTFDGTGTVLQNDSAGTSSAFCFNTTPSSNPAAYATANALSHATFEDLGFYQFTRAFDIGSQNNPGAYWCVFRNIYVSTSTQWGVHFENFSESWFENIHSVSNTIGDQWYASTVNQANYQPGNSEFHQIYGSPLNNLARGVVFAAPGAESGNRSSLNSIKVFNLQVNRFRNTLTTQTITPQNTTTNINVTDLTKFTVGMPFWVTSTADGLTQNFMYFVLSVSGSSGAGTITAGTSASATAITYSASTALTMNSYGFANLEVVGNLGSSPSKSTVSGSSFYGLDLEGSSGNTSMFIYDEAGVNTTYQLSASTSVSGPSAFVFRSTNAPTLIVNNVSLGADVDGATIGSANLWNGARGTMIQRNPPGIYKDNVVNAWGVTLSGVTGNNPDVYLRAPNGNFWYPAVGVGEGIFTQDTSATLTGAKCGVVDFNGASGQTLTLPIVDNASTKNASYQGCRYKFANNSQTNAETIATQSSQTFNNIASLTSVTIPPGEVMEATASQTNSGGILHWDALPSSGMTLSNCSSSASPAVCGSARAGSVALPTNAVSSSIVVNTTAVTANSQIFAFADDTLGTKLGVTCNSTIATLVGGLAISARTAGTSFTIANNSPVTTNPLCVSYLIIN